MAVVIPAHRDTPTFARCLDSVARLDPAPAEVVVSVDGADPAVVSAAVAAGARPVVLPVPSGPGAARNRGAEAVTSEVVLFLDSDVETAPDVVGRVRETFEARPEVAALIGSYDDDPSERNRASRYKNLLNHHVHQSACEDGFTFWGACGAIRRQVFLDLGGFDEDYVAPSIEDIELGYRIRAAGFRILVDRDVQVRHLKRWTPGAILKTDLVHRALPWSALILRTRRVENDLNVGVRERLAAVLALLAPLSLLLALRWPFLALVAPIAVVTILLADRRLLALLWRRDGPLLALWGAGWHLLYHLYSSIGFLAAATRHLLFGVQPVRQPWPGSPRRRPATEVAAPALVRSQAATRLPDGQMLTQSRRVRRGVPIAVFLVGAVVLMPVFRDAVRADGLPLIRIAQLYGDGQLGDAVNPYWGPLYSWLLAPLLHLGVEPLLATKLLQVAVGAATLVAVRRLCLACGIRTATADGMALVVIPLLLHLTFANVGSDLLATTLLLAFCSELAPTDERSAGVRARRAGVWGGLAFLAKAYALPVVVVAVVVVHAARAWESRRRCRSSAASQVRRALVTLGALGLLVVPWVAALSVDEGSLTVSRPVDQARPDPVPGEAGLLRTTEGDARFAWEDPVAVRGDGTASDGSAVVGAVLRPNRSTVVAGAQLLPVLLLACAGGWVALSRPGRRSMTPLAALLAVIAVYLAGLPFTSQGGRVLWFVVLALVPFVATAIDAPYLRPRLGSHDASYVLIRFAGFALLAVVLAVEALVALPWQAEGRHEASLAAQLTESGAAPMLADARVASTGRWASSSILCFHIGCRYVGRVEGVRPDVVARRTDLVLEWPAEGDADVGSYPVVARADGLVVRSTP